MIKYNPKIHNRQSIRLKGYDYSKAGFYFITICVQDRKHLFGAVVDGEMVLNDAGKMAETEWLNLPKRFQNIKLHEFVVMPDHFHAILEITVVGSTLVVDPTTPKKPKNPKNPNQSQPKSQQNKNDIEFQIGDITLLGQPQGRVPTAVISNFQGDHQTEGNNDIEKKSKKPKAKTLGDMVGAFQSIVTVNYIRGVKSKGWDSFNKRLFQRNYYEHIIRNEHAFHNISRYIKDNPKKWSEKKFKGK